MFDKFPSVFTRHFPHALCFGDFSHTKAPLIFHVRYAKVFHMRIVFGYNLPYMNLGWFFPLSLSYEALHMPQMCKFFT